MIDRAQIIVEEVLNEGTNDEKNSKQERMSVVGVDDKYRRGQPSGREGVERVRRL